MDNSLKSRIKPLFVKLCLFLLVVYFFHLIEWLGYPSFTSKYPFLQTFDLCIEYLLSGTLYSGQPYCIQAPITYVLAATLSFIFGSFLVGSLVFYFVSLFLVTYFTYKIFQSETKRTSFFFITIISVFFLGKLFLDDFASIPATLFLVIGFYFLWYGEQLPTKMIGSLFLALSFFSKTHTPIIIVPIFLFYVLREYSYLKGKSDNKKVLFSQQLWKELMLIIFPVMIVFFVLLLFFPNMITYVYSVHSYNQTLQSVVSVVSEIITFSYYYDGYILLLYVGLSISLFRTIFYKEFDIFSFLSSVSFAFLLITIGSKFMLFKITDTLRYFIPLFPFYMINILKFGTSFSKEKRKVAILITSGGVILLGIVFYLTLSGFTVKDLISNNGINEQKLIDQIKFELEYPLTQLPTQSGKILVGEDYYHRYDLITDQNPFVYLTDDAFHNIIPFNENESLTPDMAFAPNFVTMGIISSLDPYMHITQINFSSYVDDINKGNYSIIITTQNYDDVYKLLEKNRQYFDSFCIVRIPYYEEANDEPLSVFREVRFQQYEDCMGFANIVYTYYNENRDALCQRGYSFYQHIQDTITTNGMTLERGCNNKKILLYVNSPERVKALFFSFSIWIYLITIFFIALSKIKEKNNQ